MAQSPSEFARLLTEGLYTIKANEGKTLAIIQDEIGFALGRESGGSAIAHWRRGNIPAEPADLKGLARQLVVRGKLSPAWLTRFLKTADYVSDNLHSELFANDADPSAKKTNLPAADSRQVVGRGPLIKTIVRLLLQGKETLVSIDGQGGIGKTTIALEVAKWCLEREEAFATAVWISAADAHQSLTFETVLDEICFQSERADIANLDPAQKQAQVQTLLAENALLIVLDNLETAEERQETIIAQLAPILGASRALLTSRRRFSEHVYAVNLQGLSQDDALDLIRQYAASKGVAHVKTAASDDLLAIAKATGGSPLAIQLVVSQLKRLPIQVVLRNLQEIPSLDRIGREGEYVAFYKFVFFHSWNMLIHESKRLLVTMAQFDASNGAHYEALQKISEMDYQALLSSIEDLWEASLIEVRTERSLDQVRYYLHPLTKNFVLSDIVKVS